MSEAYRLWVNDERTVLVRLWMDSGTVEVCTRETSDHIWGPPIHLEPERLVSAGSGDPVARETTPPTAGLEQGRRTP